MSRVISRTENAKKNMVASLFLQLITAISGIVIPRLIIPQYGTDAYGLITSITQFISYIALLEAGVGGVFRASLYEPLYSNDMERVSGIINEQKRFYKRIGIVFLVYIIILCFVYPIIIQTGYSKDYVVAFILILSIATIFEYFVSLPYQCLIIADQKVRIIYVLSSIVTFGNILITLSFVNLNIDIIYLKISTCLLAIIKPLFYLFYVRKHYHVNFKTKPDKSAIKQRWNGLVHNISYYIHRNTDIILLSLFSGTTAVSIYSVYLSVVVGIEKIITAVSGGMNASIGNMLVSPSEKKVIDRNIDAFELAQMTITTILYSVTALMLIPFMKLYTVDMRDANYIHPEFGYILILAEAIYCIESIYTTISLSGNKFKETQNGAMAEGTINLLLSLLLLFSVNSIEEKLIAVACGTVIAMVSRLIYELHFLRNNLINRTPWKAVKCFSICIGASLLSIFICLNLVNYECVDVIQWILKAIISFVIVFSVTMMMCCIFMRKQLFYLIQKMLKK